MDSRPRSPSPCPAPWGVLQTGGPRPAKRLRWEEPEVQPGQSGTAGDLTSVVVLAAGCALQVPLRDADLVLEPAPASVLRVSLGNHTLILVHEALLDPVVEDSSGESDSSVSLELGSFLTVLGDDIAVEQGSFCASTSETAAHAEEDANLEFLQLWNDPQAILVAGLRPSARGVPGPSPRGPIPEPSPWVPSLDSHLLGAFPSSPLQPLPPSPSPSPHERPQRSPRPPCRARRRLF
ncbi:proline-rich protein 23A-like [Elephas maximus indicus]|uniref:proline-rich protein 23A-like n=1 Tax=Elephas maximus indicus TaxID=99487 RepID=UPI002116E3D3|nr:proline-rich protein 23A-like [Elephas maximus indicus]